MEEAANPMTWAQFGLAGLVIGAGFWYLLHMSKLHKEERAEWREDICRQNRDLLECKKETNIILRELSSVMNEANRRHRKDD